MHFCTGCQTVGKLPNRSILSCWHFCLLHNVSTDHSVVIKGSKSLDYRPDARVFSIAPVNLDWTDLATLWFCWKKTSTRLALLQGCMVMILQKWMVLSQWNRDQKKEKYYKQYHIHDLLFSSTRFVENLPNFGRNLCPWIKPTLGWLGSKLLILQFLYQNYALLNTK